MSFQDRSGFGSGLAPFAHVGCQFLSGVKAAGPHGGGRAPLLYGKDFLRYVVNEKTDKYLLFFFRELRYPGFQVRCQFFQVESPVRDLVAVRVRDLKMIRPGPFWQALFFQFVSMMIDHHLEQPKFQRAVSSKSSQVQISFDARFLNEVFCLILSYDTRGVPDQFWAKILDQLIERSVTPPPGFF